MSLKNDTIRLPRWMKVPMPKGTNYSQVKNLIREHDLHTICTSGNCPNKGECWNAGTATFMILGDKCTRNCRFCYVDLQKPDEVDWAEPLRLAKSIQTLKLKHAVITSVARDDLKDGGAEFWAQTIRAVKHHNPGLTMEVLIPDFDAKPELLDIVIKEKPEVISHNIETVERISPHIRSKATYERSLRVLRYIADSGLIAKSGLMLGLGETEEEVMQALHDMRESGVNVVTIGQYLPPSERNTKLVEYVTPEVFKHYEEVGLAMGFRHVESGPLVRSSYHAEKHVL
ncbi:lipoyl synthase [Saccharicrinis sp. FJH54]|uniref:lipoyl synthase n=1 Tax=Saccharicrinis sp. FJH54 TaxID=3344665 RepID=UPI0035D4DEDF